MSLVVHLCSERTQIGSFCFAPFTQANKRVYFPNGSLCVLGCFWLLAVSGQGKRNFPCLQIFSFFNFLQGIVNKGLLCAKLACYCGMKWKKLVFHLQCAYSSDPAREHEHAHVVSGATTLINPVHY